MIPEVILRRRRKQKIRIILIALFLTSMLVIPYVFAQSPDVKTYIPPNAFKYLPLVKSETKRLFPELQTPWYVPALIEHESCQTLSHRRCWSPTSELKTARERGAGLLMLTVAYNKLGKVRFDTVDDLKKKYPKELGELNWDNITERPDLQIRAGVLLIRDNYSALYFVRNSFQRLAMTDSAYNGGLGNVLKGRKVCGLAAKCDPNYWFGNTENYMPQSRAVLYGDRSPLQINQHHVYDSLIVRLDKYYQYF